MNTTQIALLEAIKASLFGTEPNYPADTDWAEVVKEAKAQTVLGIISPAIPVKDVSVEMGKATYMRLLFEQDKLIKLLDANDIPCVILKGFAAAQYYPKPHLRAMGDVDVLVPRDKFISAVKLLEENGYKYHHGKTNDGMILEEVRHVGYEKNGVEFELHHHFSSNGFDIDDILEKAIYKREYYDVDSYKIPMLPKIQNGLVLLGHINQHLAADDLGLRQIIDWEMFCCSVLDENLWQNEFAPIAEKAGLKRLAVNVTIMCIKYMGLKNCEYMKKEKDDDVSNLLLTMLFESGNFGSKKSPVLQNNDGVVSHGIYNIKKNGFFPYFQDMGLRRWKLCKKYTFLKPFAWLYGIFRALYRGIQSTAKNGSIKKQMNKGNEKYELFEKIGIQASSKKS